LDLEPWVRKGLLQFHAARATLYGLEMHLALVHKLVREFAPRHVVLDPITNLSHAGATRMEVTAALTRLIDFLKVQGITAMLTSLTSGESASMEQTDTDISSLVDTWLLLRD